MIRYLKTFCVAVVAVFAVSAMAASAASAAQFTSAGGQYPVAISGSSSADVIDAFGSTVKCSSNTFTASLSMASETLNLSPSYVGCTAFGLPATVTTSANAFTFNATFGTANINSAITIHIYASTPHGTPICTLTIPSQITVGGMSYINNPEGTISVVGNINGMTATQVRKSIFCPAGTHTSSSIYTIQAGGIRLSGVAKSIHVK
jgi:hypothetical protein